MGEDVQKELEVGARARIAGLSGEEREALLVKCWMSHDARWYMAVAKESGLEVANRLNQEAARETGRAEARRTLRRLGMEAPRTRDEALEAQATLGMMLTRDVSYEVVPVGEDGFEFRMGRCFAFEQVTTVGVADQYDCGIFSRVQGWWDAFAVEYQIDPEPGRCLRAQGRDCVYAFRGVRAS